MCRHCSRSLRHINEQNQNYPHLVQIFQVEGDRQQSVNRGKLYWSVTAVRKKKGVGKGIGRVGKGEI